MVEKIVKFFEKISWNMIAIFSIALGAFFYFTYDDSQILANEESIKSTADNIHNLEKKVAEAKKFEVEYELKKKQYQEMVKELVTLQGALPKQFYLPDLLNDILKEGKQLQLEISSIIPDTKEELSEFYGSLSFNLELRGTFLQFLIFMERLTTMKRLLGINSISFMRDTARQSITLGTEEGAFALYKAADSNRLTYPGVKASMKVTTYRYKAEAQKLPAGTGGANAPKK